MDTFLSLPLLPNLLDGTGMGPSVQSFQVLLFVLSWTRVDEIPYAIRDTYRSSKTCSLGWITGKHRCWKKKRRQGEGIQKRVHCTNFLATTRMHQK
jgi:hypothetical protein